VSEAELRMKDGTISHRERERETTEALKGGYDKLLIKTVQRTQSHLSLWYISPQQHIERDGSRDYFDIWMNIH